MPHNIVKVSGAQTLSTSQRLMEMDRLILNVRRLLDDLDSHRWQLCHQDIGHQAHIQYLEEEVCELQREVDNLNEQIYDS